MLPPREFTTIVNLPDAGLTKASYDAQTLAGLIPKIASCLKGDDTTEALSCAERLIRGPVALDRWLGWLARVFEKHERLDDLIVLLWDNKRSAFLDLYVVGYFLRLCNRTGRHGSFQHDLFTTLSDFGDAVCFSENAHLRCFADLTDEQRQKFLAAKYAGWTNAGDGNFLEAIDRFSPRVKVSLPVVSFLFSNREDRQTDCQAWMQDLRSSELVRHIQVDRLVAGPRVDRSALPKIPDGGRLLDEDAARALFCKLEERPSLLLATFHGSYVECAVNAFRRFMRDHYVLGIKAAEKSGFGAYRALKEGRKVLMAPDGHVVGKRINISVLGLRVAIADGAPMLAFEAGCDTGWFTLQRVGNCLVPRFEEGPRRKENENFPDFRERWWAFYTAQIENNFRGPPCNISLRTFWPNLIRAHAEKEGSGARG